MAGFAWARGSTLNGEPLRFLWSAALQWERDLESGGFSILRKNTNLNPRV